MINFIKSIGMGGGLLIVFFLLILASGAAVVQFPDQFGKFAYLVPIMFLFIAIGAFLLLLEHYAYTLHEMNPKLAVAALGLPEGSIRAFLTIGLLTLVAVFGSFLYFESGKVEYPLVRSKVPVATREQIEELRKEVGDRFVVIPRYNEKGVVEADVVSTTPDTTRSDIAKQLLTMITTVLTTVIGFYFATRATESTHETQGGDSSTTAGVPQPGASEAGASSSPSTTTTSTAPQATGASSATPGTSSGASAP